MAKSKTQKLAEHVASEVVIAIGLLEQANDRLMAVHHDYKLEDIRYTGVIGHGDLVMALIQLEALRSFLILWARSGNEWSGVPDTITLLKHTQQLAADSKAINDAWCAL